MVYRLDAGADGRISAVHFKDSKGNDHTAVGKAVVLAANGIETPKLMLISRGTHHPNGIGNSSDMVGRHLMDHPGTAVTFLAGEPLWPGRGPQEMTSLVSFRDGEFRSDYASKKIHLSNLSRVQEVTADLLSRGDLIFGSELDTQIRDRASRFVRFDSFHEILPEPSNRIFPSTRHKDAAGIPQPEFEYAMDDYVRKSAAHTKEVYTDAAKLMNGTEVEFFNDYANNNHITGTTIMGDDPADSVVDKDCRVHDHENLFIASSATMTTVGSVNCTLTIAALSLRLADLLKNEVS